MLEINNLHYYSNKKELLSGITLEVRLNSFIGISGEISSGKSYLFETVLANIPFLEGTILFENKKVSYKHRKHVLALRNRIGYVPQHEFFLEDKTLLQNLKWLTSAKRDKVIEISTKAGLSHKLFDKMHTLSNEERQYAKLALAVLKNPYLLFVDEPLSLLTKGEFYSFLYFLKRLSEENAFGVLLITNMEEIILEKTIFTESYKLEKGKLVTI